MANSNEIEITPLEPLAGAAVDKLYEEFRRHVLQEICKSIYGPRAVISVGES